ncbi:very short patch repair endonuclease [Bosea vaviloviae]|uniref:very short patch repair endonuclease n=1 Tax=Bosea vaviloviae TaxID=1526658 RepID=UPI0009EA1821|nr:DNA mismatch endonuclease Vsr [Bosea vaviloviae]
MADTLSPAQRSERMSLIRGKDTRPALVVRRMLHRLGYRFRLHRRDLPGKPDIVLPRHHAVIFVHGCFWHQHPDPACRLARQPKTRIDFWQAKFAANQSRDLRTISALEANGWRVLVVWQCELRDKEQLENKLREFLADR